MTGPDNQPTAEDIVRALANCNPIYCADDLRDTCVCCENDAADAFDKVRHDAACAWRQAVEWVQHHPVID